MTRALARLVAGLIWLLGASVALTGALLVAAWFWSAQPNSLHHTLRWATHWLTDSAGTSPLTVTVATGSLRTGGHIEQLRWQYNGLEVEVQGLTLAWPERLWLDALLQRRATLSQLSAQHVRVRDNRPATPAEPLKPPAHLALPWLTTVHAQAQVDYFTWDGTTPWQTGPYTLDYRYGPQATGDLQHSATLSADLRTHGQYTLQATLQAQGDLALNLTLTGTVQPPIPAGATPLRLATRVHLKGPLGPHNGQLQVQAQVQPAPDHSPHPHADAAPRLDATLTLQPWAPLPLHGGQLHLTQLDLATLWPGAPRTRLSGNWQAETVPATAATSTPPTTDAAPAQALRNANWRLQGHLRNALPGPWDQGALPLEQLDTELRWHDHTWQLAQLTARLGGGTLQASGQLPWRDGHPGAWQGQATLRDLTPHRLLSTLQMRPLNAKLQADADGTGPTARHHFQFQLGPATPPVGPPPAGLPPPQLQAQGQWHANTLSLSQFSFALLGAQGQGAGHWSPALEQFDGQLQAQAPGLALQVDGRFSPNTSRPSQAQTTVTNLATLQQWLQNTQTQLAAAWPTLTWPAALTDTLYQSRWQGQAHIQADWDGRDWRLSHSADAELHQGPQHWQAHTRVRADGSFSTTGAGLGVTAHLRELQLGARNTQWPYGLQAELDGSTTLALATDGALTLQAGRLRLRPTSSGQRTLPPMAAEAAVLAWDASHWNQGWLQSRGQLQGLSLSWLNAWLSDDTTPQGPLRRAGLEGDLLFDGQWDVQLPLTVPIPAHPTPPRAELRLAHRAGDLTLVNGDGPHAERLRTGLREATLAVGLTGTQVTSRLRWRSDNAGQAEATVSTSLTPPGAEQPQWQWPSSAALNGQLQADLPQIGLWSRLAPPGWRLSGRLQARATLSGSRAQPHWDGQLDATDLALRSLPDGIDFSDGRFSAQLTGETLTIRTLSLRGAGGPTGGELTGQGQASWASRVVNGQTTREPVIDLQLQARQLRLLARADRRLTLSGELNSQLRGTLLDVNGRLTVDQALLLLPDETTPTLDPDVVVRGTERPPSFGAGAAVQPRVRVNLDLGDNFHVRGLGLDSYLSGRLLVASSAGQPTPQLTGQVSTVRGSYRAYGQALNVEQGRVRFNGPVDNPSLDILALRPHPTQRVGVQIGGSAQAPTVRLYSEPDLPDSEKLAWLVLGRPASGAGAEAAILQQAALALFSGNGSANDSALSRTLGLDELSLQGESTNTDGSTTAAALTLGKRISNQLYVTYSHSLAGAVGTVSVFYDLSRYVTLRAQAGDDNAIDLIFTHSYDGQTLPPRERRSLPRTIAPASP